MMQFLKIIAETLFYIVLLGCSLLSQISFFNPVKQKKEFDTF